MKQLSVLALLFLIISISCTKQDDETITKFIFFSGKGISYNSLNNAQFEIQKYLEFSQNGNVRIAKGSRYTDYSKSYTPKIAPPFSLDHFYETNSFDSLELVLRNTFVGKSYDSTYVVSNAEGSCYGCFIYETSKGTKKTILFNLGSLPKKLDSLDMFINNVFITRNLLKVEKFEVNSLVLELQRKLFKKFPPPPPPTTNVEVRMK